MSLTVTLDDIDLHDKAMAKLDALIKQGDLAHQNRALFLLSQGHLAEGWKEYEYRIKGEGRITYDRFPVRRWAGESLTGKNVMVWLEQGVGDQIFAAGMLPDLIAIAESVTLFCTRRLVPVFRRSFPTVTVHRVGEPVPERIRSWAFDCQMSIADLGLAFRRTLNFEGKPYLKADPERVAELRAEYAPNGERLVGVTWTSGNPDHGKAKSMDLTTLLPALSTEGTVYVSLQYEPGDAGPLLLDPEVDQLLDLDAGLAQVAAMDRVITVSNTTAHMAGALGIPTTVLLPCGIGRLWYWHAQRTNSPWYPSLSLMRQIREDEWTDVIERLTQREWATSLARKVTPLSRLLTSDAGSQPLRTPLPSLPHSRFATA